MQRRYVTVDVFAARIFEGNPLAVVLDAAGLSAAQMQAIASEFGYSETTFVLPPRSAEHTAHVRLFTPRTEIPFAGHPNVGTAVVLARELARQHRPQPAELIFEELAGLVHIRLQYSAGSARGAEITAPESFSARSSVSVQDAAECLSLTPAEIVTATHPPRVVSVGLPFLAVEVSSRDALRRARPSSMAHERVLPPLGTDAVCAYLCADAEGAAGAVGTLHSRVFAPLDNKLEDPATGSAAAAVIALLASSRPARDEECTWRIEQGVDMGRPSVIEGRTHKRAGAITAVQIAGSAVPVMHGVIDLPGDVAASG